MVPHDFDVTHVAALARLSLNPEETALFQTQRADILQHVAKLEELNLEGIERAAHPVPALNIFREDEARPSLSVGDALRDAPPAANDLFLVTKVLE